MTIGLLTEGRGCKESHSLDKSETTRLTLKKWNRNKSLKLRLASVKQSLEELLAILASISEFKIIPDNCVTVRIYLIDLIIWHIAIPVSQII